MNSADVVEWPVNLVSVCEAGASDEFTRTFEGLQGEDGTVAMYHIHLHDRDHDFDNHTFAYNNGQLMAGVTAHERSPSRPHASNSRYMTVMDTFLGGGSYGADAYFFDEKPVLNL